MTETEVSNEIIILNFAEAKKAVLKENKREGYVEFGDKNDYAEYLLWMFNSSAKHGAIVGNKAIYITGNGFNDSNFTIRFNLNILLPKVALDIELYGGCYLEIIWGRIGKQIAAINHIDYLKFRTNDDNTQFWYKKKWEVSYTGRTQKAVVVPAFNPMTGEKRQILFIKEYRPGTGAYPLPGYKAADNYIEADIKVGEHTLSNAATGFTPSKLISVIGPVPQPDEKRKTGQRFEKAYTGSGGRKFMLQFVANKDLQAVVQDLGASDMTKEDFTAIESQISQNIYGGHKITSPSLFGIAEPGKLGGTTELKDAYEIFNNTYVNHKQRFIEAIFNRLARYAGETEVLTIQPSEPLGISIPESLVEKYAPQQWVLDQLGIDATKYPSAVIPGTTPVNAPAIAASSEREQMVNDHVKNMTPKQHMEMMRIIRQFNKGQLTQAQASTLLKLQLGLSDEDIIVMLGIDDGTPMQMRLSSQDMLKLFGEFGEPRSDFVEIKRALRLSDDKDTGMFAEVSQAESNVLDLIGKDKRITPQVIADTLEISVKQVNKIISVAVKKGLIDVTEVTEGKGDQKNVIIERKLTAPLTEIVEKIKPETQAYIIRYSYDWLPEIPTDERDTVGHPSREFCKELMRLDKYYSRSEIEQISAQVGYSVWDRRGGWWNDNGDNKPHCRHSWFSILLQRK